MHYNADSVSLIQPNIWKRGAVAFKSGTTIFFINGVLDSTVPQRGAALVPAPASSLLKIGFDRNNTFSPNYFNGYIDEVRVWRWMTTPTGSFWVGW